MPTSRRSPGLAVVRRAGTSQLYLRGTIAGRRIYESLGTDSPALAEEARAAREAEIYRSAVHGTAPRVTFAAAALSYLEAEPRPASTLAYLNRLLKHFGAVIACQAIDQVAIDRACRALCRPDAKPATKLRNVITPTKAVLSHASRRGWCNVPKFEKTRASPARTDWLTPAEAEAMIEAATGRRAHLAPLLVFLFCTGARMNEAVTLQWSDLDLQYARATLRDENTKGEKTRLIDLPPRAVVALANLPGREGAVFRTARKAGYRDTRDSRTVPYGGQVKKGWAACLSAAGITRALTPHHARHSWASWHYCLHKDLLRLKEDGDWSSVTLVERYAKLAPAGMRPQVLQFWNGGAVYVQRGAEGIAKSA